MSGHDLGAASLGPEVTTALERLFFEDERWQQLPGTGLAMIQRVWHDNTVDTLTLLSPDTAYAVRETADGKRPWAVNGSAKQVIDAAREVLPPDDADAPQAADAGLPMGEWRDGG